MAAQTYTEGVTPVDTDRHGWLDRWLRELERDHENL